MSKKAIETLRNGLEDSHWYSDDDEKIFNELVIKAEAFEDIYAHFNQLIHGEIEQREYESYAFDITESYSLGKYERTDGND